MAFNKSDIERLQATLDAYLERERPPPHIRPKLDYGYSISGQSIHLHDVRPLWDRPSKKIGRPFAKATYLKSRDIWQVY